jgi:cleavage and polyadenylation specificity factor subunit 1
MQQKSGDHWRPLGFFSCKLIDTESRYSTFDCRLLAAQAAIKHFPHFCEGQAFELWTDHKPRVTAISHVLAPILPRQQRHLVLISEFNVQLLYLPGLKNVVADFLSRPNQTTTGSAAAMLAADPVDFKEMAAEQNRCPETQRLLGGTSLKLAFRQTDAQCLAGDVSTGNFCPIVPLKFRKNIFDHFHNFAHPGRLASCRIISSRFVWRCLSSDYTAWAHGCLACQRGKIHCHTPLAPHPIPIPQRCFSHLHVDLVGPLQYSNNFNYIFTIIDHISKWMEAIPLSETSAAASAKA